MCLSVDVVLTGVLDLESSWLTSTGRRRGPSGSVDSVDSSIVVGCSGHGGKIQPRHGTVACIELTQNRVCGSSSCVLLGGECNTVLFVWGGVEVEGWLGSSLKVVVAQEVDVCGSQGSSDSRCGEGVVEDNIGDEVEEVRVVGGDAGGIVEICDGADEGGSGVRGGVGASVVL